MKKLLIMVCVGLLATACIVTPPTEPLDTTTTSTSSTLTNPTAVDTIVELKFDDASVGDLEHYAGPLMDMINGDTGVHTFTNAVTQDPLCSNERAGEFLSMTSSKTGIWCNTPADICPVQPAAGPNSGWVNLRTKTIYKTLHDAGWNTNIIGKMHNAAGDCPGETKVGGLHPNPPGVDNYRVIGGNSEVFFNSGVLIENGPEVKHNVVAGGPSQYGGNYTGDQSRLVAQNAPEPFYLLWTPSAPHAPGTEAPDYDPSQVRPGLPNWDASFNEGCPTGTNPATGLPYDSADDKPFLEKTYADVATCLGTSAWKASKYLPSIQAVSNKGVLLIQDLKARPSIHGGSVWDHTLFIMTSDNAQQKGSNGHTTKEMFRPRSIEIPLIVRVPGTTSATHPHQVTTMDISPTIADYTGVPMAGPIDGMSLRPLLDGTGSFPHRTVYLSHPRVQDGIDDVRPWTALREDCSNPPVHPADAVQHCYGIDLYPALTADPRYGTMPEEIGIYRLDLDPLMAHQTEPDAFTGFTGDPVPVAPATAAQIRTAYAVHVAAGR